MSDKVIFLAEVLSSLIYILCNQVFKSNQFVFYQILVNAMFDCPIISDSITRRIMIEGGVCVNVLPDGLSSQDLSCNFICFLYLWNLSKLNEFVLSYRLYHNLQKMESMKLGFACRILWKMVYNGPLTHRQAT